MLIHFIHRGDAYLPELAAYAAFLQSRGHAGQVHRHLDSVPQDAQVLWWMCGRVAPAEAQRFPSAVQVHEYASASVPPLAWIKDCAKRWRQPRPHYRIFQNDWVRARLDPGDGVPWELRDMGIDPAGFAPMRRDAAVPAPMAPAAPSSRPHDFVYLGEMGRLRHFLPLFDGLARAGRSVLLVGDLPADLRERLLRTGRVTATGRVAHAEVPGWLRQARWGLNLVPARAPYDRQTSTKLLEYCAAGLPVVSTDYAWVRGFERRHGARFAYVPDRADAGRYAALLGPVLETCAPVVPDVRTLAWPHILASLGIWRQFGLEPGA